MSYLKTLFYNDLFYFNCSRRNRRMGSRVVGKLLQLRFEKKENGITLPLSQKVQDFLQS